MVGNIFRIFSSPWIITVLAFLLFDAVKLFSGNPVNTFSVDVYFVSTIMSFLLWFWLEAVSHQLPFKISVVFTFLVSLFVASLFATNFFLYSAFHQYITVQMLAYVVDDKEYFFNYLQTYLFNSNGFIFLIFVFGWWLVWKRGKRNERKTFSRFSVAILVLFPVAFLVLLNQMRLWSAGKQTTADVAFALSVKEIFRRDYSESLHPSIRLRVSPVRNVPKDSLNIIVILNESFGKNPLATYGYEKNPMPFLHKWITRERDHFFVFQKAFTNSSSTQASVPSIYTGVAPYEGGEKMHKFPLLWDWTKAAGMKTVLVSSQRFGWLHLNEFLFHPDVPEIRITAENIEAPIVNDLGVDDIIAAREFRKTVQNIPMNENIFAVFHSNALHNPFQQTSVLLKEQPDFETRYENGMFILDKVLEEIYSSLKETQRLENSLIIITSDHGDAHKPLHLPRINSYYDEIMCIPFFVHVPEKWHATKSRFMNNLFRNQNINVNNSDIVPTIISVLGLNEEPENQKILSQLVGASFIDSLPENRILIGLNTNDIRTWDHLGFGIYWENKRFVYTDIEGTQFFDVTTDSLEIKNLWNEASEGERKLIFDVINANRFLKGIFEKRKR
ncbi:MAG: sulfatase-like hydrolase/transferase [Ignavibacteriales bacterium]|nr:sulfatase-like hydrolase/transferase [Ignavibacteriales bacterium]